MTALARALAISLIFLAGVIPVRATDNVITLALTPDGFSPEQRLPLQNYLKEHLGRNIKLVTPASYVELLDGLSSGSIDFACVGAVTYVRGRAKIGIVPLVQRASDLQFHSLVIAGTRTPIYSLKDLKGRQFAFGDINSTSGHVMPYLEMRRAGLNPGTDFEIRYSGEHPVTVKLVELGVVDAGAVDESVFNSMIKDGKVDTNKVRVIYTSKPFVDYVYVARRGVSETEREIFAAALLGLREGKNDDVLKILRASRFVRANDDEYAAVREAARKLKMF